MREDVAEAQHDPRAEYPGADAVEHVDEAIADDADDPGADGAITMPTGTGTLSATPCRDLPASTMLEAKKQMYMTPAITTTSNAPREPNCARLWIICGMPICGPWAECNAISTPPTRWPTSMATMPQIRLRWNSCTPSAPVTIGNGAMLPPNHRVNRSLTFPWRSCGGTYPIVCFSISGADDVAVVTMTSSKAR